MIYDVVWESLHRVPRVVELSFYATDADKKKFAKFAGKIERDDKKVLADKIKASPNDYFTLVLTNDQLTPFKEFLDTYGLMDSILLETPKQINPIHPESGKNLTMFVLQCKNHESTS